MFFICAVPLFFFHFANAGETPGGMKHIWQKKESGADLKEKLHR